MIAEAISGDGDAAFDYYRRINPSAREDIRTCTAASRTSTRR